jgi:hypothetical protein
MQISIMSMFLLILLCENSGMYILPVTFRFKDTLMNVEKHSHVTYKMQNHISFS